MNKAYKIVWCESTQDWVVVGELASGRKKTRSSQAARAWQSVLVAGSLVASHAAFAADVQISATTPATSTVVFTGNSNLIQGSGKGFNALSRGDLGYTSMTLAQARDAGLLATGVEYVDSENLNVGSRSNVITYTDPVTHRQTSFNVYDNSTMSAKTLNGITYAFSHDVGATGQYLDKNLYSVSSGANLTVNTGVTDSSWTTNNANKVNIVMKGSTSGKVTSSVFSVDDGGTLNYGSKTLVTLGNYKNVNSAAVGSKVTSLSTYAGEVDSKIGHFTVNSLASYQAYNTALINAIKNGSLSSADYVDELTKGRTPVVTFTQKDTTSASDPVNAGISASQVAFIKGKGAGANISIANGANLQLLSTDASLISVEQNAHLTNNGTLSTITRLVFRMWLFS